MNEWKNVLSNDSDNETGKRCLFVEPLPLFNTGRDLPQYEFGYESWFNNNFSTERPCQADE